MLSTPALLGSAALFCRYPGVLDEWPSTAVEASMGCGMVISGLITYCFGSGLQPTLRYDARVHSKEQSIRTMAQAYSYVITVKYCPNAITPAIKNVICEDFVATSC